MTSVSDIRRKNLHRLKNEYEQQFKYLPSKYKKRYTNVLFCKAINLSPSMYSQLINQQLKPVFNERYARNIEEYCNLKKGWFDIDYENLNMDDLSVGLDAFKVGYMGLQDFLNDEMITISNDEAKLKILEKLFIHLAKNSADTKIKLSRADFLDFIK